MVSQHKSRTKEVRMSTPQPERPARSLSIQSSPSQKQKRVSWPHEAPRLRYLHLLPKPITSRFLWLVWRKILSDQNIYHLPGDYHLASPFLPLLASKKNLKVQEKVFTSPGIQNTVLLEQVHPCILGRQTFK